MKIILAFLGFCAVYYPILIIWDKKKRKKFQLEQKESMGKLSTPSFDTPKIANTETANLEKVLAPEKELVLETNEIVDEDMDQLLSELEAPDNTNSSLETTAQIIELDEQEMSDMIERTINE